MSDIDKMYNEESLEGKEKEELIEEIIKKREEIADLEIKLKEAKAELYANHGTIVVPPKVYPNDACPCGSGKKYKKCCGKTY